MASGEPLPDTLNASWKNNKSRFGYKMLQKMGWSEEKGLGKYESGTVDAIKLKKREEGVGLGVEKMTDGAGARGWSQTANGFSSVLDSLKATYGSSKSKSKSKDKDKDKDKDGKKSKKKENKEKRKDDGDVDEGKTAAAASLRIQVGMKYRKHSLAKSLSNKTEAELRSVLGAAHSGGKAQAQIPSQVHSQSHSKNKRLRNGSDAECSDSPGSAPDVDGGTGVRRRSGSVSSVGSMSLSSVVATRRRSNSSASSNGGSVDLDKDAATRTTTKKRKAKKEK